ncbi:hypothetical protein FB451DRAFT_1170402 [Mycena latifolia]|nr:hypothetical protein FB451DRAFT_1170402 [Mycena latifolia]
MYILPWALNSFGAASHARRGRVRERRRETVLQTKRPGKSVGSCIARAKRAHLAISGDAGLRILQPLILPLLPPFVAFPRRRRPPPPGRRRPRVHAGQARALAGAVRAIRMRRRRGCPRVRRAAFFAERMRARGGRCRVGRRTARAEVRRRGGIERGAGVVRLLVGGRRKGETRGGRASGGGEDGSDGEGRGGCRHDEGRVALLETSKASKAAMYEVTRDTPPRRKEERSTGARRGRGAGGFGRRCLKCQGTTPRAPMGKRRGYATLSSRKILHILTDFVKFTPNQSNWYYKAQNCCRKNSTLAKESGMVHRVNRQNGHRSRKYAQEQKRTREKGKRGGHKDRTTNAGMGRERGDGRRRRACAPSTRGGVAGRSRTGARRRARARGPNSGGTTTSGGRRLCNGAGGNMCPERDEGRVWVPGISKLESAARMRVQGTDQSA